MKGVEYFFCITLADSYASTTMSGVITFKEGTTRLDALRQIKSYAAEQYPNLANGGVMFFDLQPNELT